MPDATERARLRAEHIAVEGRGGHRRPDLVTGELKRFEGCQLCDLTEKAEALESMAPELGVYYQRLTAAGIPDDGALGLCLQAQGVLLFLDMPDLARKATWRLLLLGADDVVQAAVVVLQSPTICAVCFCIDAVGCDGGCSWAHPGLCTSCETSDVQRGHSGLVLPDGYQPGLN